MLSTGFYWQAATVCQSGYVKRKKMLPQATALNGF